MTNKKIKLAESFKSIIANYQINNGLMTYSQRTLDELLLMKQKVALKTKNLSDNACLYPEHLYDFKSKIPLRFSTICYNGVPLCTFLIARQEGFHPKTSKLKHPAFIGGGHDAWGNRRFCAF